MPARTSFACAPCPIARTADFLGDAWTLLILREACFYRAHRFADFEDGLGIPTNVLATRLKLLVDHGVLSKRPLAGRAAHQYGLTTKGGELWSVIAVILSWGNRWMTDETFGELPLIHRGCGARVYCEHCSGCGARLALEDVEFDPDALLRIVLEQVRRWATATVQGIAQDGLIPAARTLRKLIRSGALDPADLSRELAKLNLAEADFTGLAELAGLPPLVELS